MFGFLMFVFVILVLTCCLVSILLTYFALCAEVRDFLIFRITCGFGNLFLPLQPPGSTFFSTLSSSLPAKWISRIPHLLLFTFLGLS